MVMIIEIFVAQYQSVNPLSDQLDHAVLDIALVPVVDKQLAKSFNKPLCRSSSRRIKPPPSLER